MSMRALDTLLITTLAAYVASCLAGFVILLRQGRRMKREQLQTVVLSKGEKSLLIVLLSAAAVLYLLLLVAACMTAGENWLGEMKRIGLYGLIAIFVPHYGFGLWTAIALLWLNHKRIKAGRSDRQTSPARGDGKSGQAAAEFGGSSIIDEAGRR